VAIIREIEALASEGPLRPSALAPILRKYPREGKGLFSRSQIIAGFRAFAAGEGFATDAESFARKLRLRPVRTRSGVAPLSVLTKPYPCPGECVFCPNDLRMPKSYLADEPGAQRAAANRFDPYLQTWNRLDAFRAIGHATDKIELIVLGGTWSFYPEAYRVWFTKRCLEAMNDFGSGVDGRDRAGDGAPDFSGLEGRAQVPQLEGGYNRAITELLSAEQGGVLIRADECADWAELELAQRANQSAACRCVGLALETRPDRIDPAEVLRLRRLGCTKVQLGVQSLSDAVLSANRRGHGVAATRRSMGLLRAAGFKIHAHWMPNLLGSTPESDVADFELLFDDPDLRPDELKIYPCSLIESAELMRFYRRGQWRPYQHGELLSVLTAVLERVPHYCRVTRVIRDFSSHDIVEGNRLTNFRELAERALRSRGGVCRDIRSREIRSHSFDPAALDLRASEYATGAGVESFLEYVTPEDRIVAFLRLLLPSQNSCVEEIAGRALIRELHVYGASLGLGERSEEDAQHRGLGRRLLEEAGRRARAAGFAELSVISAVGTRPYYRKLGFRDGPLYQHLRL
jgi:elongator complex protein 3